MWKGNPAADEFAQFIDLVQCGRIPTLAESAINAIDKARIHIAKRNKI